MEYPKELEFLNKAEPQVDEIQQGFDRYQEACFTARAPEFFALELCGEAGELANLEKKRWKGKNVDRRQFEDEAADVFIALMNYCNAAEIDLGSAVADKVREIERRRQKGAM